MYDRLSIQQRVLIVSVALSVVASGVLSNIYGGVAWVIALVFLAAGWRYVPGFWRTISSGALGGVIAGLLLLGPGFRLAMRVVAILEPTRAPEFTIGGTLFIVVFIGGMFGGIIAVGAALVRRGLGVSGPLTAGLMTVTIMGILLVDSELRSEFVDLGAGPWLNIPMFGAVVVLYGLAANRVGDMVEKKGSRQQSREPAEVQG